MSDESSKLSYALLILSDRLCAAVNNIPKTERAFINELRLRLGRGFSCTVSSKEYYITASGRLTYNYCDALTVTDKDIKETIDKAFEGSFYSFHKELTQGYITAPGGNRVGFCGTAVLTPDRAARVDNVKHISSVNIRIAREVIGCGEEVYMKTLQSGTGGLIIGGPPSSGKTTVLRDLCRLCGDRERVSVIDERGELSNSRNGIAMNDIGKKSDVFLSYGRYDAIMTAVRVMSPQIIIIDEIGAEDDLTALRYALCSGVKIIAATHCNDIDDLKKRPVVSKLIKQGAFGHAVILSSGVTPGRINGIYSL